MKEAEKDESIFDWKTIENLISKDRKSVASIIKSFGDVIIDFIKDKNDCEYSYRYIDSIISFYKLSKNEKNDVVEAVLYYFTYLNDNLLDNKFLIEIWANILFSVIKNKIFLWSDFEKLTNLTDEQYNVICEVSFKTLKKFTNKEKNKIYKDYLNKLSFFKGNAIFEEFK